VKASARLTWAVACIDVQPDDLLLELGCGHGVAISLVCERLLGGSIVALDRSPTMTALAHDRNRDHVRSGKAVVLTASLHDAPLGEATFDKVFGIHFPPLLRGDPEDELRVVARHLAPGGALYVLFQPHAPSHVRPALDRLSRVLADHGFVVERERVDPLEGGSGICVVATARS
jgi:SAM-dependent methyltransferase